MKGNITSLEFRIHDEECFETIIDDEDDILVDSSKNSDNIDLDGSYIENDDVDESQFDNCEDESDIESENNLAEEILNDDLPGIFKN